MAIVMPEKASTDKGFTRGTHRRCSPAETWERIQSSFAKVGLTRNADITGLDRLGVPVTLALRPNSPTMANSTGKGLTREAALVSGAMEAMELFHAEHVGLPVVLASHDEMACRGAVLALNDLPLTRNAMFTHGGTEQWVSGPNLQGGDAVAVPYSMVALWDRSFVQQHFLASFQQGSNGLASGNDWAEAMVAALLEVIERDAVTSHHVAERQTGQPPPRVRLETIASPIVQELVERLSWAGVTPVLHDCRTDTAVPVFLCHLYDPYSPSVGVCAGYGAHLDPEIAMLRALTEAAQCRLVIIAGSRDDIFRRNLRLVRGTDAGKLLAELSLLPRRSMRANCHRRPPPPSPETLMSCLPSCRRLGCGR